MVRNAGIAEGDLPLLRKIGDYGFAPAGFRLRFGCLFGEEDEARLVGREIKRNVRPDREDR